MKAWADHWAAAWAVAGVALAIAAVGARPFAGGWNDGSRLASVESLIDRGTFAIDDSVFCGTPPRLLESGHTPYAADQVNQNAVGTLDKLFVRGHFYTDKPAAISVLMAGVYRPLMELGLPAPGERPDVFAWVMTVLTSGVGYAAAVGCLWIVGRRVGLPAGWRLAWVAAFALATVAPAYTRHANAHMMQLGAVAGMCVLLCRMADATRGNRTAWGSLVGLGVLAGFAFNLDFGSGPPLAAAVFLAIAWRTRRFAPVAVYTLAALPGVAAGLGLNYALAGVWLPMNMYPQFFDFPGSPFTATNLTGFQRFEAVQQVQYAAGMLFSTRGFLNHNFPLLLVGLAAWVVVRRAKENAELVALLAWCVGAWAVYAALSNNMGGACCSVRWFVPFLAPGFWALAVLLRDRPGYRPEFVALSVWGAALAASMWWAGPWTLRMVPLLWPLFAAALVTWSAVAVWRRRPGRVVEVEAAAPLRRAA